MAKWSMTIEHVAALVVAQVKGGRQVNKGAAVYHDHCLDLHRPNIGHNAATHRTGVTQYNDPRKQAVRNSLQVPPNCACKAQRRSWDTDLPYHCPGSVPRSRQRHQSSPRRV